MIQIGVSACLLGQPVRYDGTHRFNQIIVSQFANEFELIGLCPEMAIGLGVPRPTIQLLQVDQQIKLVGVKKPEQDHTEPMINYGTRCLQHSALSGMILKDRSPSCGVANTPVYDKRGHQLTVGHGLFTRTVINTTPVLPIISAEQLQFPEARNHFIDQVKNFAASNQAL